MAGDEEEDGICPHFILRSQCMECKKEAARRKIANMQTPHMVGEALIEEVKKRVFDLENLAMLKQVSDAVEIPLDGMSVAQLKASLKSRGLRRTGNKRELALRLQDALQEEAERELRVDAMTVAELKTELKRRGLKVGGTKAELVARLQEALDC